MSVGILREQDCRLPGEQLQGSQAHSIQPGSLLYPARLDQRSKLAHELGHILEVKINRSKTHVGHFVELLESAHYHLADLLSRALSLAGLLNVLFYRVDDGLHLNGRDRSLLASLHDAGKNFQETRERE